RARRRVLDERVDEVAQAAGNDEHEAVQRALDRLGALLVGRVNQRAHGGIAAVAPRLPNVLPWVEGSPWLHDLRIGRIGGPIRVGVGQRGTKTWEHARSERSS